MGYLSNNFMNFLPVMSQYSSRIFMFAVVIYITGFSGINAKECSKCWHYRFEPTEFELIGEKPLGFFMDSLPLCTDYKRNDFFNLDLETEIKEGMSCEIDTAGIFNKHMVLDIIYKIGLGKQYLVGKTILIETAEDKFRPIYVYLDDMEDFFPKASKLAHVDSHDILISKTRLGGQGAFYDEQYWTWNDECDCPCLLKFDFSFEKIFTPIIKEEFKVSHIGSFDPDSLYAWSFIARPGDHDNWPMGGTIWVKLKIEGCDLMVIDSGYNAKRVASH
ncbi:hypothetical protein TRIP_C90360 [Candidatus Zixiibacteriota bacterium]|nr:hypothetical protein TRIP_C90360 [candidate division Zixibacteria bacterium]